MQLLLRWAVNAGALYATVWVISLFGQAQMKATHWYSWFLAVIIMALVNSSIRPILRVLTAPLNCLTFGILGVLINGLMFWLVPLIADNLGVPVFTVKPLGAVLGSILVGLIGGLVAHLVISE